MVATDAWYYEHSGPLDVLKHGSVELPQLQEQEVLLEVRAASFNPIDTGVRFGVFAPQSGPAFPMIPGYDVSGVVKELGPGITKFKVGDQVYGAIAPVGAQPRQYGTMAKHTVANVQQLAHKPAKLTHEEAAAVPVVALTAKGALEHGKLKEGEKVLITGGAGGVGTHAIQIAKVIFKAGTVATTASGAKIELVRGLGADVVIDYKAQKFEEELKDYDLVLDTAGDAKKAVAVIKPGRKVVSIKVFDQPPPVEGFGMTSQGDALEQLTPYFESGAIKPVVDPKGRYSFSQVKEAFQYLETGRAAGKIVVSM